MADASEQLWGRVRVRATGEEGFIERYDYDGNGYSYKVCLRSCEWPVRFKKEQLEAIPRDEANKSSDKNN